MFTDCNADLKAKCSKILFLWSPTSKGEKFPKNYGLTAEEGSLLLEVVYNPGSGYLYDGSGLDLYYSSEPSMNQVYFEIFIYNSKSY